MSRDYVALLRDPLYSLIRKHRYETCHKCHCLFYLGHCISNKFGCNVLNKTTRCNICCTSFRISACCGKRGIRTPGTVARTPHFECGPFDHSGIFPKTLASRFPSKSECKYSKKFFYHTNFLQNIFYRPKNENLNST